MSRAKSEIYTRNKEGIAPGPGTSILPESGQKPRLRALRGHRRPSGCRVGATQTPAVLALFFLLSCLLSSPAVLSAQEPSKTYQTKYASITYSEERDLHTFTRNTGTGLFFMRESPEKNPLLAKNQVDKIVETICSLLDMYPSNLRFGITLYRTQDEVTTAYHRVSSGTANAYKAQSMSGPAPIAFYYHGNRNIAVAIDNITDYILAHEIGHAIISAYFIPPPPGRMQEILCQYMDKHFREK